MSDSVRGGLWFVTGIVTMAFVIGLLSGASASPVVAVVLPLLFGLFSVGGTAIILRKAMTSGDASGAVDGDVGLIGKQLLGFACGFLVGIWLGIGVKVKAISLWPEPSNSMAAFGTMKPDDMLMLSAAIHLDDRMQAAGLPVERRREIFEALRSGIQKRATNDSMGNATNRDHEIARAVLQTLKEAAPERPLVPTRRPTER